MALALMSPAFEQGSKIPEKYTCDGEDISPPLHWSGVPEAAKALMIACDDPDAPNGTFHHWVAYNIPPHWTELKEDFGPESIQNGLPQAINDFKNSGYGGPCPPEGHGEHHYHFRLSALSEEIKGASAASTCEEIMALAKLYVIEFTELVGVYEK